MRRVAEIKPEFWSARQVCEYFGGVSLMWIVRRTADANFPPSVKFGGSRSPRFWKADDVRAWATERAKAA